MSAPLPTSELPSASRGTHSLQRPCSLPSASDSRIAKPKEQWCLKGHSAICDTLCTLWCCKHEHQQALLAKAENAPAHRPALEGDSKC